MNKLCLFLIVMPVCSFAQGQSIESQVGKSKEEVMLWMEGHYKISDNDTYDRGDIEGNPIIHHIAFLPDTMFGIIGYLSASFDRKGKCEGYVFKRNDVWLSLLIKKYAIYYEEIKPDVKISDFERAKEILTKKYGKPHINVKTDSQLGADWYGKKRAVHLIDLEEGVFQFGESVR